MKKSTLWVGGTVIALAAVIVAWRFVDLQAFGLKGPGPCNAGVCKLTVTVNNCTTGDIVVDRDPLPVPAPNNIEWTVGNGYKFTVSGIQFQDPSEFPPNPGLIGGGSKWKVKDLYDKKGDFKYSIQVYDTSNNVVCKVKDPLISNQ